MATITTALKTLVLDLAKEMNSDLNNGVNFNPIFNAYNYYQESEHDGRGYIFDLFNKEDLKFLLNNDLIELRELMYFFTNWKNLLIIDEDGNKQPISVDNMLAMIKANLADLAARVILFAARCGNNSPYANIYEIYVVERGLAMLSV